MPQKINPKKKTMSIFLGEQKIFFLKVCEEEDLIPSRVLKGLVKNWLLAKQRKKQRKAKAQKEEAA